MKKPESTVVLPRQPIDLVVGPLRRFLHIEAASGVVLLAATALALALANSPAGNAFLAFWKTRIGFQVGSFNMVHPLYHWINDGLMAIFFFVIGLEVKREIVMGELQDLRKAALPISAALGGMLAPAGLYLLLQGSGQGARGWGIPMATDIAFVVGCLAILGARVPNSFRVFLLSLAIADDIGAILVIAVGYTESLDWAALALGLGGIGVGLGLMKAGVRNVAVYFILMFLVWLAFHESGVHATIAGVIFGLLTPTRAWVSESRLRKIVARAAGILKGEGWRDTEHRYEKLRLVEVAARKAIPPLERFENELHPWVGFVIMPLFALANAGVAVKASDFTHPVAMAILAGLLLGKPAGILLLSWLAVKFRIARLPDGIGWKIIAGGGFLAGIGFTMALFIAGLALEENILDAAKVGILAASVLSAITGMAVLNRFLPKNG